VNWDPKLLTAISDLEVQQVEVKGSLWYLRYPLEGKAFDPKDPASFMSSPTTRPETMLGDSAVAVHPDDERQRASWSASMSSCRWSGGRFRSLPMNIPIPKKARARLKVTPAHDFNDFEVGRRHNLPQISVLDQEGLWPLSQRRLPARLARRVRAVCGGIPRHRPFRRAQADLTRLEDFGFLEKTEPNTHMVPHGDRSGVIIEPYLTTNGTSMPGPWRSRPSMRCAAARRHSCRRTGKDLLRVDGKYPAWCISRQLWWGHQIPAWYGPTGKVFVAETEEEAIANALGYYAEQEVITPEQGAEMALDPAKRGRLHHAR